MKRMLLFAAVALAFAVPTVAGAQEYGFATGDVNLRSGPDIDYPVVTIIPEGSELDIQGCTQGWEWCDVIVGEDEDRGWVAGNLIAYDYNDQPVLVSEYGGRVGVPIVSFTIGNYWDRYYRNRPFYSDRYRWYHRPYVRHPAPRPFIGWNLRFGINGRDYNRWHDHRGDHHDGHGGWDRDHYYNHGSDRGHDHDRNHDHGHDRDNGHGRVYPLPHPTPDNRRDAQQHAAHDARDQGVPKPAQRFGHNPQPSPQNTNPQNGGQKGSHNAKPDDSKKKDEKKDHDHHH